MDEERSITAVFPAGTVEATALDGRRALASMRGDEPIQWHPIKAENEKLEDGSEKYTMTYVVNADI